jgi:ATP-binding cassette subfamily F protein 3
MRQSLSRALVDYAGALVVISHDRHLLRSVCDELWIVNHGRVERFDRSLDDYPAWLKEQQVVGSAISEPGAVGNDTDLVSRKARRQLEARQREKLKPLRDRVKKIDSEMATLRQQLEAVERGLADVSLYSDPARKDEMNGLNRKRAVLKSEIESLEWSWLEASEALEHASAQN